MATMNIKDPRVHELAHRLATLRGSTATAAVREALEAALAEETDHHLDRRQALKQLQARVRPTANDWVEQDELYDESGVPR